MKNYFLKGISIAENRKNKKNKLASERERIVFSMRVQTSKLLFICESEQN